MSGVIFYIQLCDVLQKTFLMLWSQAHVLQLY